MTVTVTLLLGKARYSVTPASADATVGDVKALVAAECEPRLVPEAQRIIIAGKLRADQVVVRDCLSRAQAAKVEQGDDVEVKGRIMLAEGFADVLEGGAGASAARDEVEDETGSQEAAAALVHRKRPSIPIDSLAPGAVLLTVQQGAERHQIVAPNAAWTVGEVKQSLKSMIGVPAKQQRVLINGKVREDDATLQSCGVEPPTAKAMLLFSDGYHAAVDGLEYLEIAEEDLSKAEAVVAKVKSQLRHRLADPVGMLIDIDIAIDRLENATNGLDGRPVPMSAAERRRHVLTASARVLEELRDLKAHRIQL